MIDRIMTFFFKMNKDTRDSLIMSTSFCHTESRIQIPLKRNAKAALLGK